MNTEQGSAAAATALGNVLLLPYARRMETQADDSTLMRQYANGDVGAFERLYRRHNDVLFRYLLRLCYRRDVAEEVFQETWGKVVNARRRYRPTARFRTYLFHIARNCHVDHLRRNQRHENAVDLDLDEWPASDNQPEAETEKALARRRLDAALREIPEEQRDAFLLREEAGLSVDEIAEVTGVKAETAKSRLRYATNKLRAALDEADTMAVAK